MNDESQNQNITEEELPVNERWFLVGIHLGAWLGLSFIPSLIFYVVLSDGFVRDQAKNALNFQLSIFLYSFVSVILTVILIGFLGFLFIVPLFYIAPVIALLKTIKKENYEYPFAISFVK